jgi:hypothetical protein
MPLKLSEVSSKYGAPMGRRDTHADDQDAPIELMVHHLPFVDGDYDSGGAYWGGGGGPLWRATEIEGPVEFFIRAKDRWEALEVVREEYPAVHIVDTPRDAWFEDFVQAYEEAALWSSTDVDPDDPMHNVELDNYEAAESTKAEFREDCKQFVDFYEPLLLEALKRNGYTAERAGHDYWLTRNHHGAGFFDRFELYAGGLGEKLTKAAHADGGVDLYLGDDKLVYSH